MINLVKRFLQVQIHLLIEGLNSFKHLKINNITKTLPRLTLFLKIRLGDASMPKKKLTPSQVKRRNQIANKLKGHKEVDDPYAIATYMTKKGCRVHKKRKG